MKIQKYDIVQVNLNPKKGHKQAGIRPAIIVQSNMFNKSAPTVIILPLTTKLKKPFPSEFIIYPSKVNWLDSKSRVLWSQITTIDKDFINKKIGTLENKYFDKVAKAINTAIDLYDDYLNI